MILEALLFQFIELRYFLHLLLLLKLLSNNNNNNRLLCNITYTSVQNVMQPLGFLLYNRRAYTKQRCKLLSVRCVRILSTSVVTEGLLLFNYDALKGVSLLQCSLILSLFCKMRLTVKPLTSDALQISIWRSPASVSNDIKLYCE